MLELIAIIVIIVVALTYALTIPYRRLGKYGGRVMPPPPKPIDNTPPRF